MDGDGYEIILRNQTCEANNSKIPNIPRRKMPTSVKKVAVSLVNCNWILVIRFMKRLGNWKWRW
jgi:hypothetical protein